LNEGRTETFELEASKQTSSPIFERATRALERGLKELEGMIASNNVVEEERTIAASRSRSNRLYVD